MHAISSYRDNRPTNTQTGPITIHCAVKLSAQYNNCNYPVTSFNIPLTNIFCNFISTPCPLYFETKFEGIID